jgi:hypothetical protein
LRLQALHVGDFIDALDRDQRRIHVHRQQLELGQLAAGRHEGIVEPGRQAGGVDGLPERLGMVDAAAAPGMRTDRFDARGAGQGGNPFDVGGSGSEALQYQVHEAKRREGK